MGLRFVERPACPVRFDAVHFSDPTVAARLSDVRFTLDERLG